MNPQQPDNEQISRYVPLDVKDLMQQLQPSEQQLDLSDLFKAIWQGKWFIVAITGMFAVASIIIVLQMPNLYKAEAIISPANTDSQTGLGALASQFGGLASFAGISLGSGQADQTAVALEILKSRKFISQFIRKHDVLVDLMASKNWDWQQNVLVYDESIYSTIEKKWVRTVEPPRHSRPSEQEAYKAFKDILYIDENKESGMVLVSIEHFSPFVAKDWLDKLIIDLNTTMKLRDVRDAERSIEYLNQQIDSTNVAGLRSVFFELIEEQTKTLMLANVTDEYAFNVIDPAVVEEQKYKPRRALLVILGTMMGLIIAFLYCLIRLLSKK